MSSLKKKDIALTQAEYDLMVILKPEFEAIMAYFKHIYSEFFLHLYKEELMGDDGCLSEALLMAKMRAFVQLEDLSLKTLFDSNQDVLSKIQWPSLEISQLLLKLQSMRLIAGNKDLAHLNSLFYKLSMLPDSCNTFEDILVSVNHDDEFKDYYDPSPLNEINILLDFEDYLTKKCILLVQAAHRNEDEHLNRTLTVNKILFSDIQSLRYATPLSIKERLKNYHASHDADYIPVNSISARSKSLQSKINVAIASGIVVVGVLSLLAKMKLLMLSWPIVLSASVIGMITGYVLFSRAGPNTSSLHRKKERGSPIGEQSASNEQKTAQAVFPISNTNRTIISSNAKKEKSSKIAQSIEHPKKCVQPKHVPSRSARRR